MNLDDHITHLKEQAIARCRFSATTAGAFADWLAVNRQLLSKRLQLPGHTGETGPVAVDEHETVQRGGLSQTKMILTTSEEVQIPVYRLSTAVARRRKGRILVFPGHNPSVQYCLGNYPDPSTEAAMRAKDNPYAEALAVAGWEVFAVEQQGFGERQTARQRALHDGTIHSSCRDLAIQYQGVGRCLLGERVRDAMCVLSFVRAIGGSQKTGVTGNSGGGTTSLWLAALDDRVDAAVVGSYLCGFRDSIYAVEHCDCNYVPGLLELLEMGDLAAMLAPRPVCFIHGEEDPIYPIQGTREQFETVRRACRILGQPDRCRLFIHPGGHAYHIGEAVRFFNEFL